MSSGSGTSWLITLVVAPVLVAAIIGIPWWFLGRPSFKQVRRYVKSFFVEPAPGTHFTVLIADLEGDEDLEQTKLLAQALVEARGLEVISKGRRLADADIGGGTRAREEAEETGQGWLAEHNADVLVWGHATGSGLKLHFLPREGKGSKPPRL